MVSRDEAARERSGAELARTELAKAQLRLEAMPRLEADLVAVRAVLEAERTARQQAKEDAAVLASKLEAAERRIAENEARSTKAEAATKAAGQQHTAELAEYKTRFSKPLPSATVITPNCSNCKPRPTPPPHSTPPRWRSLELLASRPAKPARALQTSRGRWKPWKPKLPLQRLPPIWPRHIQKQNPSSPPNSNAPHRARPTIKSRPTLPARR